MSSKYVAIIVQCLFLAGSAYAGRWLTDNAWQSKYDQHLLADAKANEKAATETLTKQQKLIKDLDDAKRTTLALQEKHDRNVSDSRIAAERLRAELDRIKAMPKINNTSTISRARKCRNR
jgi:hypothetical protein